MTSLGSAIFAFLAAGAFRTIEEAQDALCPGYATIEPEPAAVAFTRSCTRSTANSTSPLESGVRRRSAIGDVLPELRRIAAQARGGQSAGTAAD